MKLSAGRKDDWCHAVDPAANTALGDLGGLRVLVWPSISTWIAARPWAQAFVRSLPESQVLLDVGSGNGRMLSQLAAPRQRVVACDVSHPLLCDGRTRLREAGLTHIPFVVCDARALSFRPQVFHRLMLIEIIEHIPTEGVGDALAECYRVLRPGGRLLVVTPNLRNLQRRLGLRWLRRRERYPRFPAPAMPGETMVHYTEYEPRELTRLLTQHKFHLDALFGDVVGLSLVRASPRPVIVAGSQWLGGMLPGLSNHLVALARRP